MSILRPAPIHAGDVQNLPIIAVDMPDDAVGDPAGSTLRVNAHLGLVYIMKKAAAMRTAGETLPVVVNLSYGPHEGPHDGSDPLEGIMDLFIKAYTKTRTPLKIVLAAGNSRQSRVHASFGLARGGSQSLAWRLQPAGLTASLMEIWATGPNSQFGVKLTSPTGATIQVAKVAPLAKMTDAAGNCDRRGAVLFERPRAVAWCRSRSCVRVRSSERMESRRSPSRGLDGRRDKRSGSADAL